MFDNEVRLFLLLLLSRHCFICLSQQSTSILSFGKPAFQTTTYVSGDTSYNAGLAVDGNNNMDFLAGSCSRTFVSENTTPYWYVNLGDMYSIDYILVYSVTQYEENVVGIEVYVSSGSLSFDPNGICGSITSTTSTPGVYIVYCNPPLIGDYVALYQQNSNEITLCEVLVYGGSIILRRTRERMIPQR
ncbi:fucolectin-like isoform X2 [Antedon mediterranea]|uniref:fucolectin-like isoform X2 n=1 Tax=Antedon mediterranea TaxID=105859 RepID=UPI003AF64326